MYFGPLYNLKCLSVGYSNNYSVNNLTDVLVIKQITAAIKYYGPDCGQQYVTKKNNRLNK